MCLLIPPGTHQSPLALKGTLVPVSKGLSFPENIDLSLTCLDTPVRVGAVMRAIAENIFSGAGADALEWTIRGSSLAVQHRAIKIPPKRRVRLWRSGHISQQSTVVWPSRRSFGRRTACLCPREYGRSSCRRASNRSSVMAAPFRGDQNRITSISLTDMHRSRHRFCTNLAPLTCQKDQADPAHL